MATLSAIFSQLNTPRGRAFCLPREHGAWGMLVIPLVTGAAAGDPRGERMIWISLFAAAVLGLFCLRTPLEAQLETSSLRPQTEVERKLIHNFIYFYASVALLPLAVLLFWAHAYGLMLLGTAAAIAFVLQSILKRRGRDTRLSSQLMGAVALSSTGAGAYYLATGHFGPTAALIWLANWLLSANQIHFVQLRLHSARELSAREKVYQGRGFLLHQTACLLLLALMWRGGGLPALLLLAFAPVFARGFVWFVESPRPPRVYRLGQSELVYAIVFGMLFIAGCRQFG